MYIPWSHTSESTATIYISNLQIEKYIHSTTSYANYKVYLDAISWSLIGRRQGLQGSFHPVRYMTRYVALANQLHSTVVLVGFPVEAVVVLEAGGAEAVGAKMVATPTPTVGGR